MRSGSDLNLPCINLKTPSKEPYTPFIGPPIHGSSQMPEFLSYPHLRFSGAYGATVVVLVAVVVKLVLAEACGVCMVF